MKTMAREGDKQEIVRRLKAIRPDSRRRWGRMSVHQMICHLNDAFLAVTGRRPVSTTGGPLHRTVIKWFALYVPIRWPAGYPTRPEIDQMVAGTPPVEFAADLTQLERLVEEVTSDASWFDGRRHPIFGPMSRAEWLRWAYLHVDHHLRQFGA